MNRFVAATLAAAAIVLAALILTHGATRWGIAGGAVGAYAIVTGCGVAFIRMHYFAVAFCRGEIGAERLALTFDDGPDPRSTPALLDALRRLGVHATFFCIGERAAAKPELVRRMADEKHEIGNHSFHHAWWTNFLLSRGLGEEIERTQGIIRAIANVTPRYFRPPMGLTNPHLPRALRETNVTLVGWDAGGGDRKGDVGDVVERILRDARDGSIILLHDGGADPARLVGLVDEIVSECRRRGYSFVSLEELSQPPQD